MRTYLVPFTEKEKVTVSYVAKVEAKSKEAAYGKIIKIINENESPHEYFDADYNGIAEHLDGYCDFEIEPYDEYDIKEVDERLSCECSYTSSDILRLGKDGIHKQLEENFLQVGIRINIIEMDMIPVSIEQHFVNYRCIPTEHKIFFTDDTFIHWKDGIKMNPDINLEDLKITPLLMSKSCNYDSTTNIKLSKAFPIAELDKTLCDNKSDVVKYNGQTYLCGVCNDGYALWVCEV